MPVPPDALIYKKAPQILHLLGLHSPISSQSIVMVNVLLRNVALNRPLTTHADDFPLLALIRPVQTTWEGSRLVLA